MKSPAFPVTDDHIHIDPLNGRGIEAAKDFQRAGGTHLFLVSKPSWSLSIHPSRGLDYSAVFDETIRVAGLIGEIGLVVYPVLAYIPLKSAGYQNACHYKKSAEVMKGGIDCAAGYIEEGKAVALKSGRPHYEVPPEVWSVSNEILCHALDRAAGCKCALQVHAESGPCADVAGMAKKAGVPVERVVKHYGSPETPLHPSLIARHEAIPQMVRERRAFTMESDFMDENSRPGAVTGPKSVPRYTNQLLRDGLITPDDCFRIHAETIGKVYGVVISL